VFRGPELAVVVEAHRPAVRAGVVDGKEIADRDFGQAPLDGELIVVLAQALS